MTAPPSETQRVAADLSRKIRDMQPGDEVGSVRALAAAYDVSHDVARRALALLSKHGLVRAEARRHVVANPNAPLTAVQAIDDLSRRMADVEAGARGQAQRVEALEREVEQLKRQSRPT